MEEEGQYIKVLDEEPILFDDMIEYMEAFGELNTSRTQGGFSVGMIPYSEITNYLDDNNIFDYMERKDYRYFIGVLDQTYIDYVTTKQKEKEKTPKPSNSKVSRKVSLPPSPATNKKTGKIRNRHA